MKPNRKLPLFIVTLLSINISVIPAYAGPTAAGDRCESIFTAVKTADGLVSREERMLQTELWQISVIDGTALGKSDTPPFYFEAADGVESKYLIRSDGNGGVMSHIAVSGLGADGLLRGTLSLPVSGHTGFANARLWSKQDTYSIFMQIGTGPNGNRFASYADRSSLIPLVIDAPSRDLITRQDVTVPMVQGQTVRLLYFRSGSGGPGGYPEGRLLTLIWDGK